MRSATGLRSEHAVLRLSSQVPSQVGTSATPQKPSLPRFVGGDLVVGPARFELATSCTPSKRAKPDCATARCATVYLLDLNPTTSCDEAAASISRPALK